MSRTALDTSVLVAAIQSWHTEHERALHAVSRALAEASAVVPYHALIEAYSVLTRMPKPLRLSPESAFLIAEIAFRSGAQALLTLNRRDFERVAPESLAILEP